MYASVDSQWERKRVWPCPSRRSEPTGQGPGTVLVVNAQHPIETRNVKLGNRDPDNVELLSGLDENEL